MKRLIKLFSVAFVSLSILTAVPIAYAGCMDNAEDAVFAFFTGGATAAACEVQELVDAIQNFIKTVSNLASNVANNAKQVANAAVGAVNSAVGDIKNTVNGAQMGLNNAVSEAQSMTSPMVMAPSVQIHPQGSNMAVLNHAAAPKMALMGTSQGAAKTGVNNGVMAAPILNAADPQQLHAALVRGTQELSALKSSVDQDIAGRINNAVQRAGDQATSHLADAADIVKTALLAPINALLTTLNDLVKHPTTLLDPIATINTMVDNISNNVVNTMNHINDVITKDAIATLGSVEGDVQQVQDAAQSGDKLLKAMRLAHQQKTKSALNALESQLNALAPRQTNFAQSHTLARPKLASFRFASVQSRLHATLQQSVMPYQTASSNLKNNWAKIKSLHFAAHPRPLDVHTKQTAQAKLDQMFRGKSPIEVEHIKQDLLNQARVKFGSDPKLMASIQQNLDGYIQNHVVRLELVPTVKPPNPNRDRMLNPQPLPPRQGIRPGNQLPKIQ